MMTFSISEFFLASGMVAAVVLAVVLSLFAFGFSIWSVIRQNSYEVHPVNESGDFALSDFESQLESIRNPNNEDLSDIFPPDGQFEQQLAEQDFDRLV